MNLNADQTKLIFGKKNQQQNHPNLYVNQRPVLEVNSQKHLRIFLDKQLDFKEHFSNISDKVNKVIGDLRKLRCIQPTFFFADNLQFAYGTPSLLKRRRSCDQVYNPSFHPRTETLQCSAELVITDPITGPFRTKDLSRIWLAISSAKALA